MKNSLYPSAPVVAKKDSPFTQKRLLQRGKKALYVHERERMSKGERKLSGVRISATSTQAAPPIEV